MTVIAVESNPSQTVSVVPQMSTEVDLQINPGPDHYNLNEESLILNYKTFNDSNTSSIINESENVLLKIEIEPLNSQINSLTNQPFSFTVIENTDSLIIYYTGFPNKATISLLFDIFTNVYITYFMLIGLIEMIRF